MLTFKIGSGQGVIGKVFFKYKVTDLNRPLLIMFGSLNMIASAEDANDTSFEPWGYRIGVDYLQLNVLCFTSYRRSEWYQCDEFASWLVKQRGFLEMFPSRLGYGASMGAFGVSKFFETLLLNRALLLNPISTLSRELVPWETRHFNGAADSLDWDLKNSDGAAKPISGVVVFDPLYELDRRHARRYKGLKEVFFPGVGHQIPKHLLYLKLLKKLLLDFTKDQIDFLELRLSLRRRRTYPHYYDWLLSPQNKRLTSDYRKSVIIRHRVTNIEDSADRLLVHGVDVKVVRDFALRAEEFSTEIHDKLIDLVASPRAYPERKLFVDSLRDCALALSYLDKSLAKEVFELVLTLRPNGRFIKKKLEELESKVT